jgi:flotillin
VPLIGINRIILSVSIFEISENNYQAYDKQKVPFAVDIKGFFRIIDPKIAAERVTNHQELTVQLTDILRGAIRKVLAGTDIVGIMETRREIGEQFTIEVKGQLLSWGVETVKSIELMDIRDGDGYDVISSIMNRKISLIQKESRVEVAENNKVAEIAEITAEQEAETKRQEAEKIVGERTAEKEKAVGIAKEKSKQDISTEAKTTAEKDMDVLKVQQVKNAEIEKEKAIIKAEEAKATQVINAEGEKQMTVTIAEGALEAKKKEAEGTKTIGLAEADATSAMELAKIAGQVALAEKISTSPEYIAYLENIRAIEAGEKVGTAKADALGKSDVKIVSNSGNIDGGVNNVLDIFSGKGGNAMVSMIENLSNSEGGKALVDRLLGGKKTDDAKTQVTTNKPVTNTDKNSTSETKTNNKDKTE